MKTATFTVRIQIEEDQEINPFYLTEELQASINSMYSTDNRILGYKFEYDSFVPFTPKESYHAV